MPQRLPYVDSCRVLQQLDIVPMGEFPPLPYGRPAHDDKARGVSFIRLILAEDKMEYLTLPHTYFYRSELRDCSFIGSNLSESTANWNDFNDVDFRSADLSGSDFRACLLEGARFAGARLVGVDFRYCGFKRCDFLDADLTDAKMTRKVGMALQLTPEQHAVIDWQSDDGEEPPGGG